MMLLSPVPVLADLQAAEDAYSRGDFATALHEFRALAETGDSIAQHRLGEMYRKGKGVPTDLVEAAHWYRLSAEKGYARAQNRLGLQYSNGEGVAQDEREALVWHRQAAEQGHADAQNRLGLIYDTRHGIAEDILQAYAWFSLAAVQGDEYASRNKISVSKRMTPAQIAEAQKLSQKLCANIPNCAR